jgi:hypothetical protein
MAEPKRKKSQELPMELPRVPRPFEQAQYMRLRLPPDIMEEVEKEAAETGAPLTRVVINRLARVKPTDNLKKHEELNNDVEVLLTKFSSRIDSVIYGKNLLRAVDDVLAANPAQLEAKLDQLRIERRALRELERIKE